jgi:hypothetical protein
MELTTVCMVLSIVVEDTGEFLAEFDLSRSELTSSSGKFGILLFLAMDRGGVGVR